MPVRVALAVLAGQFVCGVWGLAATVRIVDLEEMAALSDRVFRGRCLSTRQIEHSSGLPVVEYTFQVLQGIKGATEGEEMIFRQLGGTGSGGFVMAGLPSYVPGQDVLLFLNADSRIGLTSPVGLSQGVFRVHRDSAGEWLAVNGLDNLNLIHQGAQKLHSMGIGSKLMEGLGQRGPVSVGVLVEAVRTLETFHQRRETSLQ